MLRCLGFLGNSGEPPSGRWCVADLPIEPTATSSIRLVDFVLPLVNRRNLIFRIVALAAIGSVAAALLWPKTYRASATLLPPERRMDNPLFVPGSAEALGASLRGITLRHVATPSDVFVAILESRTVRESLVQKHGLQESYRTKSLESATKRLAKDLNVRTTQDGMIVVAAIAKTPEKAAELANGAIEELDNVNRSLSSQEAAATRAFIEKELTESRLRLTAAEDSLQMFQEKFGAIEVGEQAKVMITAAAQVRAKILNEDVQLGVLRRTRDDSHPDVINQRALLSELRARLQEIEGVAPVETPPVEGNQGAGPSRPKSGNRDVFPPLSRVPELGFQYGRLLREVKTEEAVVALLTEQFHWARVEEKRSLPTVRILDRAMPPEKRYRPRRTFLVLVSCAAAGFASIALAYVLEIVDRVRAQPGRYAGLHELAREFRRGMRT